MGEMAAPPSSFRIFAVVFLLVPDSPQEVPPINKARL